MSDDDALPPHLAAIYRAAHAEFATWEASLPHQTQALPGLGDHAVATFPHPSAPEGLPADWSPVSHLRNFEPGEDLTLARRPAADGGGWMLVHHEHARSRTRLFWFDATLGDLYHGVLDDTVGDSLRARSLVPVGDWLRRVLTALFDDADPVEAAEKMLFALGGPLVRPPARAH